MSELRMLIEPRESGTRIALREKNAGLILRAQLRSTPASLHAPQVLMEALALWQGEHLHAALIADGYQSKVSPLAFFGAWFPPIDHTALFTFEIIDRATRPGGRRLPLPGRCAQLMRLFDAEPVK